MAEHIEAFDAKAFRSALSSFPSGVTIVTTRSAEGTLYGFTASSFTSLSLDPPLVLVCLDRRADCFPVFTAAERFIVNIATPAHAELAVRFATKGEDKFAAGGFRFDEDDHPVLSDAAAVIRCALDEVVPGGDHVILIGRVHDAQIGGGKPVTWYRGGFVHLGESAA